MTETSPLASMSRLPGRRRRMSEDEALRAARLPGPHPCRSSTSASTRRRAASCRCAGRSSRATTTTTTLAREVHRGRLAAHRRRRRAAPRLLHPARRPHQGPREVRRRVDLARSSWRTRSWPTPTSLEAAVIAVPDEKWGERPCACVVLQARRSTLDADGAARVPRGPRGQVVAARPRRVHRRGARRPRWASSTRRSCARGSPASSGSTVPTGRSSSRTSTSGRGPGTDLLRRADCASALLAALEGVDRLVLLGDVARAARRAGAQRAGARRGRFSRSWARRSAGRRGGRARARQPRPPADRPVARARGAMPGAAAARARASGSSRARPRRWPRRSWPAGSARRRSRSPTRACGCATTSTRRTATTSTATWRSRRSSASAPASIERLRRRGAGAAAPRPKTTRRSSRRSTRC